MNWEAIGAIGEIMAAAAVIGSLIFVGWQMLQNTNALHTATSHSHMEIYTSLSMSIAENRELATLWSSGLADFSSLDDVDRVRFIAVASSAFRYYETSYVQHSKGNLDDELWNNIEKQLRDMTATPGVVSWWELRRHWYSVRFSALVESLIASDSGQPLYERMKA